MNPKHIRVISICIIRRDDAILVFEGYDPTKDQTYYRPLGETVRREFREEIGAELLNLRYLTALENIFTAYGRQGHEVVMVYEGKLADKRFYEKDVIDVQEDNGERLKAYWIPLDDLMAKKFPLYPDGLLGVLENSEKN